MVNPIKYSMSLVFVMYKGWTERYSEVLCGDGFHLFLFSKAVQGSF